MKIGDVVIPIQGHQIFCGSGCYTHAIVVNLDPFVLVSEHGDMLWTKEDVFNFNRFVKRLRR